MKKYIKLSEYARLHDITYVTAYSYFKKGMIENVKQLETGTILVEVDNDGNKEKITKNATIYARVSSNEMKKNLVRQQERLVNYAISNGYNIINSVREVGSGLNDNRQKLQKILKQDDWDVLIVEHKDRLTRFGFNYIKTLLESKNKEVIVVNQTTDDKTDLMEDLISIVYSFSARMYGLRRSKNKTEKIISEIKKMG